MDLLIFIIKSKHCGNYSGEVLCTFTLKRQTSTSNDIGQWTCYKCKAVGQIKPECTTLWLSLWFLPRFWVLNWWVYILPLTGHLSIVLLAESFWLPPLLNVAGPTYSVWELSSFLPSMLTSSSPSWLHWQLYVWLPDSQPWPWPLPEVHTSSPLDVWQVSQNTGHKQNIRINTQTLHSSFSFFSFFIVSKSLCNLKICLGPNSWDHSCFPLWTHRACAAL